MLRVSKMRQDTITLNTHQKTTAIFSSDCAI